MIYIKDALLDPAGQPDYEPGASYVRITMPFRNASPAGTGTDGPLTVLVTSSGLETPPLQPGPATITLNLGQFREQSTFQVVIPDGTGPRGLWPIIAAGVLIAPDTPAALIKKVFDDWLAGGVGSSLNDPAGRELAVAESRSQFNFAGNWNNVPGIQFTLSTETPTYLSINLGTCVLATTTRETLEQRILDQDAQTVVAYSTTTVIGDASGFDSVYLPVISGRIPGGVTNRTYIVQIKSSSGKNAYITPVWLAGAVSTLTAIGA